MSRNTKTSRKAKSRETQPPALIAYHVSERGEKSYWTRIGAAWDHDDTKGLTVQLDLVPVKNGRIVLREPGQDNDNESSTKS